MRPHANAMTQEVRASPGLTELGEIGSGDVSTRRMPTTNSSGTRRRILRLKPALAPRLRLVCFPYAGGNAVAYHPWGAQLPSDIELLAVQYAGRGARFHEPPHTRLVDLLNDIQTDIETLDDVPMAFFGHSMGATVAFELTHRLVAREGAVPIHLFLSARSGPRSGEAWPSGSPSLDDASLLSRLHALSGTSDELLANPEMVQLMLRTLRADLQALCSWHHEVGEPLQVPITALGGNEDPFVPVQALDTWRPHTAEQFTRLVYPGNHFYIRSAYPQLLRLMVGCLRDAA